MERLEPLGDAWSGVGSWGDDNWAWFEKELIDLKGKLGERDEELNYLEEFAKDEFEKMIKDYESLLEEVTVNSPTNIKKDLGQSVVEASPSPPLPAPT